MLFHGALFELALFELPQDDDGVEDINVSDTLLVALAEALEEIVPRLDVSDSLDVLLADVVASIFGDVSASDALSIALSDDLGILGTANVLDGINVTVSDVASPLVQLARSDALSVFLTEGIPSIASVMAVSDALGISIDDAISLLVDVSVEDLLSVAVLEAANMVRYLPARTAIGGFGAGSASGGLRSVRIYGNHSAGRASGNFGR